MSRQTIFSEDRVYRYTLWREWEPGFGLFEGVNKERPIGSYVNFICLNPSTADETKDDPTIRRCIGFAKAWGFGAFCMTNLFAYRLTDSKQLPKAITPIGDENDSHVLAIAARADLVIAAWGTDEFQQSRAEAVRKMLGPLTCLKKSESGRPYHPLYLRKDLTPIPL